MGHSTIILDVQTAGCNKSFQCLVFILTQLHFGQWSSLLCSLPGLIVQPTRIVYFTLLLLFHCSLLSIGHFLLVIAGSIVPRAAVSQARRVCHHSWCVLGWRWCFEGCQRRTYNGNIGKTDKEAISPIIPRAPICSSRHFYLPSKVRLFCIIRFHPSHRLFAHLRNHSTVSLTIPLGDWVYLWCLFQAI